MTYILPRDISGSLISEFNFFRHPVVNPPEFRKRIIDGPFFCWRCWFGFEVRGEKHANVFKTRKTVQTESARIGIPWQIYIHICHISTWLNYPILLHDYMIYDIYGWEWHMANLYYLTYCKNCISLLTWSGIVWEAALQEGDQNSHP